MRAALVVYAMVLATPARAATPPIRLSVDAREAGRRILHARLVIPAAPGALTLHYPKWIPGEHTPGGPIVNLAGLYITAGGKAIAWQRDPIEEWSIHLQVPGGASDIEVALDYLSPTGVEMTPALVRVLWNQVLLYPAGRPAAEWTYQASLRLPDGWKLGTALPVARTEGSSVEFKPVSLVTLIDSPVLAGANLRTIALGGTPAHEIIIAADSAAALDAAPETIAGWKRLVAETGALFGARHYGSYHFLLALSDHISGGGLEHHESSDNRSVERALTDESLRKAGVASLLPHEFAHSWNGKYRRPAGLITTDYQQPVQDQLLWVYEGLTDYLGFVLTARSGLRTIDLEREVLAATAADMDHVAGRSWRPLGDVTTSSVFLYASPREWQSWRRSVDFYPEGILIWLEVDTILRARSGGKRSLDDFCRAFHGGASGSPGVMPYRLEDVTATLEGLVPYDWGAFFHARIDQAGARAPLGGIANAGWKLVYSDKANEYQKLGDAAGRAVVLQYSLGATVREDGGITDVVPGLPAARAGLGPGMRIVAVDGRRFSAEVMRSALKTRRPFDLLIETDEFFRTHRIDYTGGERSPHLERDSTHPDLLLDILKPRAP